jgi:hypothetical protein
MGLFSNLIKTTPTAEEKLSTGELNWRLKPEILSTKNFPNYMKFISSLEDENEVQFGIHNDISNDEQKTLILRIVIYDKNGNPNFIFCIFFIFAALCNEISFLGNITDYNNPREMFNPKKENLVSLNTKMENDLRIDEYEKYFKELLNQSLSIQGLSPYDYSIKGKKCVFKEFEQLTREKYK